MPRARRVVGPEVVDVLSRPEPPTPPVPSPDPVLPQPYQKPVPDTELTPEQRRIRDLEDQLAIERGRKDPQPELDVPEQPGDPGNIFIYFVEDGFTALGKVWYRGQELEFAPGSPAYADTCDRNGRSWLTLRGDDNAQITRFGRVMFRPGRWPGKTYKDAAALPYEPLKSLTGAGTVAKPTDEELNRAAAEEHGRRRAAPRLPAL
jgi:hypothetical protein